MVLVEAASLVILIQFLMNSLGKDVKAITKDDKITIIDNKTGAELTSISTKTQSYSYIEYFIDRTTTIKTTKQEKPDISIKNEQNQDIRIFNITLVPPSAAADFKTKGVVRIEINGRKLLSEKAAGTYTDIDSIGVPIPNEGLELEAGKTLDIFVWSPDATSVNLTSSVLIGAGNNG